MPLESRQVVRKVTFNKYGYHLKWPELWLIILGSILIFLSLCVLTMEIGHTAYDPYRSTAFVGFIIFIPLVTCSVLVLLTAWKPFSLQVRITAISCIIAMVLCVLLIIYDILVLVDPSRCFMMDCNYAQVRYSPNSTYTTTVTGWPLSISWPDYFQTAMKAKRIFQSLQLFFAVLFIIGCLLYIFLYLIYREIDMEGNYIETEKHYRSSEYERAASIPSRHSSITVLSSAPSNPYRIATVYTIQSRPSVIRRYHRSVVEPIESESPISNSRQPTIVQQRADSMTGDRMCTRCSKEPQMILVTEYERKSFNANLCISCNQDDQRQRRKPIRIQSLGSRKWKH